jgi:hypothetical protein
VSGESVAEADPPRIVAIADTDSYVKWAAALLGTLGERWDASLLVLQTPVVVSDSQLRAALSGSGLSARQVERASYEDLRNRLEESRPDAVLIAARGPLARVLARDVAAMSPRPVIATGLPGISIPATRKAVLYRLQCDLFVLHSKREVRAFRELSVRTGLTHRFALAALPFARRAVATREAESPEGGTDLVFATQARVPAERADRLRVAEVLRRAALADPSRRVVVKLRASHGEHQTHVERDGYPELLAELGPLPPNLVTSTAPMSRALASAEGLVTVSSTAAIEAVALGVPVIALDTFGVSPELINEVLADGGLLGGEDDVIARRFRHPYPEWLDDNYFHPAEEDDWERHLRSLVAQRAEGGLVTRPPLVRRGGMLRDAWERKVALGSSDTSAAGRVALAVGVPARALVRAASAIRRLVVPVPGGEPWNAAVPLQQPGPDGSSAQVRSTSAVRTSTTRTS